MNSISFTTNLFTRKPSGRSRFHLGYFCIHMATNMHKGTNRRLCRPTSARTFSKAGSRFYAFLNPAGLQYASNTRLHLKILCILFFVTCLPV